MNRIYQGRVTSVEIYCPGSKDNPWQPFDPDPQKARAKISGSTTNGFGLR